MFSTYAEEAVYAWGGMETTLSVTLLIQQTPSEQCAKHGKLTGSVKDRPGTAIRAMRKARKGTGSVKNRPGTAFSLNRAWRKARTWEQKVKNRPAPTLKWNEKGKRTHGNKGVRESVVPGATVPDNFQRLPYEIRGGAPETAIFHTVSSEFVGPRTR